MALAVKETAAKISAELGATASSSVASKNHGPEPQARQPRPRQSPGG
jgi:hypothetical protein